MTTRTYFIECSGNSIRNLLPQAGELPCGAIHGSFRAASGRAFRCHAARRGRCGRKRQMAARRGRRFGAMSRSIPLEKALDDAMIALYQNGERLRPEQGYPVRLLLPGWEGNMSVKWLRRIKAHRRADAHQGRNLEIHRPAARRERASVHVRDGREIGDHAALVDPDDAGPGPVRDYRPCLVRRGRIARVDVSTDGGATWRGRGAARATSCSKSLVRFRTAVGMERRRSDAAKPRDRRERQRAAAAQA